MRKVLPVLALPAILACGPLPAEYAGRPPGSAAQDIINGEACGPETMDTAVAILVDATFDFFGQIRTIQCTGTLIAPDVVLTAAHCTDASLQLMGYLDPISEAYYVTFESDLTNLAEGGTTEFPSDSVQAAAWIAHPEFDINNMTGVSGPGNFKDVALLFLDQPITRVQPEVVITADEAAQIATDVSVEIAGWGAQTPSTQPPPGTVGAKQCATSFINEVGASEMQIGGDGTTSRKCHGDSGGPTYMEVTTSHDRSRRVVGITSHAYDDTDCAKGGVDTRVDAYLDWIDSQMTAACDDSTRAWCEVRGIIPPSFYDAATDDDDDSSGDDDDDDSTHEAGCGCAATPALPGAGVGLCLAGLGLWALRRWR